MGLETGRTPAARFATRTLLAQERRPWLPAPQPHVTIELSGSFMLLSGLFTVISWVYVVAMSYGGNSVLAGLTFSSFLLSNLLALGVNARLSAEFTREHFGYNVPLSRRVFIWHRSMSAAFLAFYIGCLLLVATSAWALIDTARTISGVLLGLCGLSVVCSTAYAHWSMVTHPLGVNTQQLFSAPQYEFWAPEDGRSAAAWAEDEEAAGEKGSATAGSSPQAAPRTAAQVMAEAQQRRAAATAPDKHQGLVHVPGGSPAVNAGYPGQTSSVFAAPRAAPRPSHTRANSAVMIQPPAGHKQTPDSANSSASAPTPHTGTAAHEPPAPLQVAHHHKATTGGMMQEQ